MVKDLNLPYNLLIIAVDRLIHDFSMGISTMGKVNRLIPDKKSVHVAIP